MNRVGWLLLLVFVTAAVIFGFMLSKGEESAPARPEPVSRPGPLEPGENLVIPVAGIKAPDLSDTWGDSRGGGERRHNAIDIMAPRGTLVVAAAPGTIEKLFVSRPGGNTVYVRSNDGRIIHYYAHLDAYRDGLAEGQAVRTGDVIGTVGSTGNASPDGPHLHFEVKRMREGESWHQGQPVNPYLLLADNVRSQR